MGARFDRLRCEVFQNLFLSPMNTGFVRPAVATVLTVYGIETLPGVSAMAWKPCASQQYLPFTVLKLISNFNAGADSPANVATVLTVYGIETLYIRKRFSLYIKSQQYLPFTVLKLV